MLLLYFEEGMREVDVLIEKSAKARTINSCRQYDHSCDCPTFKLFHYRTLSDELHFRWMKRDRNGETLVQQMLQEHEPELEETQIAAIRAMNDPQPVVAVRKHAQVDYPQVGQASGQQQTH